MACAYAVSVGSDDVHAEVKLRESDVRADGFIHKLEISNGISAGAEGDEHGNMHGHYEYVSPEGQHIRVEYVATLTFEVFLIQINDSNHSIKFTIIIIVALQQKKNNA